MTRARGPLTAGRLAGALLVLTLALAATLIVGAGIGSSGVGLGDLFSGGEAATTIVRLRIPRLLLAAITGAALGAAGAVFQGVLRNPLADPYILGVSGGAALGAFSATAVGLTALAPLLPIRAAAAFVGAVLTVAFLFALSRVGGRVASYPMLLIGVVTNTVYLAVILFIQTLVELTRLHGLRIWMIGSIPLEGFGTIAAAGAITAIGVAVLGVYGRELNLLSAGEEAAQSLGVGVARTRARVVALASLLTAAVVAVTGPIGFVGLIVPHVARLLFGPDHRLMVPAAALCGAIFLAAADTAARTVMAPTELPVGVITALCGGPFFLWLYRRQRGRTYFE
ncbi:MAG TPA: iron ABC transporter permease [Candidatus Polarisedimenticolia bacterium]|nr:iron ABC transporter permease [Candidatus Polarisedimenticolia bacterium]